MKLVMYGGGHEEENLHLDKESIRLTGLKEPRITYIPSCSFGAERLFIDFIQNYKTLGLKKFIFFPVDLPFDQVLLKEVFKSDIIHLAGGNTFYFLKYLKLSGVIGMLKDFVERGGVLTGLSAGAILMTPDIKTASYPSFDCDDNEEGLRSLKSMGMVSFEFFPHYKNSKRYETELLLQSKKTERTLYAVPDHSGIVVDGNNLKFVGKVYCFYKGQKVNLSQHLKLV